ncbi:DUF1796 family putative cysteine peptidase [Paeniroseomonas aquatica]|uniref:DUF1796 family putative cysteine peptidase n=1 Tax=Paeniroseomonas aquatica TaxID=373043 RepID=UPI00361260FF
MQYDEYISLGSDCEGGFQIRRILGHDSSNYFNWNVTDLQALKRLLENRFAGVLQPGNVSVHGDGGLLNDHLYEYKFHSPSTARTSATTRRSRPIPGSPGEGAVPHRQIPAGAAGRACHRLFLQGRGDRGAGAPQRILPEVRDILAGIHGAAPFVIVAVMAEDRREEPWGLPQIHNRYLRRIAPWNDAPDGHVGSWDRLFYEFPHKEPMRFSGY